MSDRTDVLCRQVLQKDTASCTLEELQQMANDYPYFVPVQLLLADKLASEQQYAYLQQMQKAILYYPHPFQFHLLFAEEKNTTGPALPEENTPATAEAVNDEEPSPSMSLPAVIEAEETEAAEREEETDPEEAQLPYDPASTHTNFLNEPPPAPILTPPASNELAFEPFHTVDYFASQGIKLSQEENTQDQLGKQLKSFTDWIKSMKRLSDTEPAQPVGTSARVENLAAHSVEDTNIYTETMADIWASQGNAEKAIEIYNKLSLLNPSKNAYFAAKIDSLKKA